MVHSMLVITENTFKSFRARRKSEPQKGEIKKHEQRKQERKHAESKVAEEKRLSEIEARLSMICEKCEAKDAELLQLHSKIDRQDKEIETLKRMLDEQRAMMEMYADINSMHLNRILNSIPL